MHEENYKKHVSVELLITYTIMSKIGQWSKKHF